MPAAPPAPDRWRAFATAWCGHGVALVIAAVSLPATAAVLADPDLAATLDLAGVPGLGPQLSALRRVAEAVGGWTPWILALAGLSLAAGGLALWRPRLARWPLHLAAAAHVIAVPWATWRLHAAFAAPGWGLAAGDAAGALTIVATAVLSSWYVERMRSTAARPPD